MEFVFDVDLNSFLVDVEIDVLQILILISFERFIDTVPIGSSFPQVNIRIPRIKVGCVLPTVIRYQFRMRQYREDDHRENAPHFIIIVRISDEEKSREPSLIISKKIFQISFGFLLIINRHNMLYLKIT